jgi:hypothetical protein
MLGLTYRVAAATPIASSDRRRIGTAKPEGSPTQFRLSWAVTGAQPNHSGRLMQKSKQANFRPF